VPHKKSAAEERLDRQLKVQYLLLKLTYWSLIFNMNDFSGNWIISAVKRRQKLRQSISKKFPSDEPASCFFFKKVCAFISSLQNYPNNAANSHFLR
jgi:hypothetical protein